MMLPKGGIQVRVDYGQILQCRVDVFYELKASETQLHSHKCNNVFTTPVSNLILLQHLLVLSRGHNGRQTKFSFGEL